MPEQDQKTASHQRLSRVSQVMGSAFSVILAHAALVTGSLVAASACSSFGGESEAPPTSDASDASDASSADGTTVGLDGSVSSDGSTTPDAAVPCPAGATCYGFESTAAGVTMTEGCSIVDTVWHRGAHSAHCKGPKKSYFEITQPFTPGGAFAFRAYIRGVPPIGVMAPNVGYLGLIDTSLDVPRMMVGDTNARRYDLLWTSGQGGGWISSNVADGSPSWTCVEAVFALPNDLSFFVNGTQADFTRTDAQLGSTPLSFRWGLPYMPTPDAFQVYVDDIAIGTTRIGCD